MKPTPNASPLVRRHRRASILVALAAFLAAAVSGFSAPRADVAPAPGPDDAKVAKLEAKADALVDSGQIFEAISTLDSAVEIAPQRFDLRLKLASLEKKRGMWLRSAGQYRAILAADPRHIEARLGYGELLLADYQFKAATQEFRALIAQKPPHKDNDRALVGLGTALYGMEEYKEAGDVFDVLVKDHPENPTAHAYKNLVLRKLGDLDGAVAGWRRYLELKPGVGRAEWLKAEAEILRATLIRQAAEVKAHPDDAQAHENLGDSLLEKPDLAAAIDEFQKANALAPEEPDILLRLGTSLRDAGRCGEAIPAIQKLMALTAYRAVAGYNLAHCAAVVNKPDLEIAGWTAVLEINHADRFAYRRYLQALGRRGRLNKEAKLLVKAIKERAGDPVPRIQYGILAEETGAYKDAAGALLDALTLEPNDPEANRELARVIFSHPGMGESLLAEIGDAADDAGARATAYRKSTLFGVTGESGKAIKLLEAYTKKHSDDVQATVLLAGLLRASGSPVSDYEPLLESARDAQPGYFYARLQLAMALQAESRFDAAAAEAREALKIRPDSATANTVLGSALRDAGGTPALREARVALERAIRLDPMDATGVARFLLSKVAWQLGKEVEARRTLRGELPVDPEEMYDLAWEFIRSNYRDRKFNGQNWNDWKDRYRGTLKSRADALSAISVMLASLDDRDTRLRAYDQTVNLFFTKRSLDVERDPQGRAELSSKTVKTAALPENVGYVAVSNMTDPKLVKEVEGAVTEMENRDGVILDLRGNQGGAENEVDQVTSMLVPSGTPTGTVKTPEGRTERVVKSEKPPILPDKPIVVLVDENTASSAELLAGSLKESKRAVVVGQRTYGKAGIQIPRLLPDGTTLLVAIAESGDLAGNSYADDGIKPDFEMNQAEVSADPGTDPAVLKAREILRLRRAKEQAKPLKREKLERDKPQ